MRRIRKKPQPKVKMPCWVLPLFMTVYCECLLHLWTNDPVQPGRQGAMILFALGFGSALALVCSFFPKKAGKWAAVLLSVLLFALYFAEYLIHDAFQSFMTISTMRAGAGGVVSTYLGVVLLSIAKNWWRIGLLLLPVIAFGTFGKPAVVRWSARGALVAAAAVFFAAALGMAVTGRDSARLKDTYNFDSAVRTFGLSTALVLEEVNNSAASGNLEFDIDPVPEATLEEEKPESTCETEATESPVVYRPHTLGLDFAALAAGEANANVAAMHQYVAGLTPAMENEYTGLFAGKNLIFITAEAFSSQVLDPELTPTLCRLATEGIQFTDYYQPVWGAGTTGGEYTNLVGNVPVNGSCMREAIEQDLFLTIGNRLQDAGYSTAAFHNNDYTYYSRHETHEFLGYDYFMGYGNGIEEGVSAKWPQSDLEMIDYTLSLYIDQQPFHAYYMSVSGHSNYDKNENAMSRKNYDKVAHLDCSEPIKCYIAANLELENAVASLVAQLEAAGIADDTVIVIASDHYPYGLEASTTWGTGTDYLTELYGQKPNDFIRDKNTLIIWSGSIEDMDLTVDTPTFSLDILPTLLNLFGLEYDSRLLPGRDVFSEEAALVFWPLSGSWKTEKGSYDQNRGVFTPAEGVEVDDGYVDRINAIVRNKIKYSKGVAQYDYYNYITRALEGTE